MRSYFFLFWTFCLDLLLHLFYNFMLLSLFTDVVSEIPHLIPVVIFISGLSCSPRQFYRKTMENYHLKQNSNLCSQSGSVIRCFDLSNRHGGAHCSLFDPEHEFLLITFLDCKYIFFLFSTDYLAYNLSTLFFAFYKSRFNLFKKYFHELDCFFLCYVA